MQPRSTLIVEDQADAREWISVAVTRTFPHVRIDTAGTLAEARRLVDADSYDVALIDLGLPDGNGLELIEAINASDAKTVTVVTTVFGDDEHLFSALRAGAQGYVLKSDSKEELASLLSEIVSGQPPLSPAIARRLLAYFRDEGPKHASEVSLTERERDVLTLLAKGYTVARVADLLDITRNTAAGYAKSVYRKLNVSSRAEATLEAARRGLVKP